MRLTCYESTTSPARLCQLFFHAVELFVFFYYKQKQLIHRRYLPDRRGISFGAVWLAAIWFATTICPEIHRTRPFNDRRRDPNSEFLKQCVETRPCVSLIKFLLKERYS